MSLYADKEIYLNSHFKKVAAAEFYRDLFPENSFEMESGFQESYEKTNKGNGFVVYVDNDKHKTRMIFDNLDFSFVIDKPTAFMSPISYFGRNRTSANARELFALVFDLDEVGEEELENFFGYWIYHDRIPIPTYVVNSGGGVHLYYVFENPIPLYPNIQKELKQMKYELTDKIWNGDTSKLQTKQFQGINQGFRLVGGKTKKGEEVTAYKTGEKITLEILNKYVSAENQIKDTFYHSKITLEQAKEKYPEWYEQRIVQGRKKSNWTCKRDLYDWWKSQKDKAQLHHRYFYIMCLAVYAIKCEIPFEELKKDAYSMIDFLSGMSRENPFTKADVKSALEMYQECYRSFPRNDIAKLSAIPIQPNKRNGRTQEKHLQGARAIRDINNENWRAGNGRKSVENAVSAYLNMNPGATYKQFVEETGMQKSVFYKYKKQWIAEKTKYSFPTIAFDLDKNGEIADTPMSRRSFDLQQ